MDGCDLLMMRQSKCSKIICVLGPTGSGKNDLALELGKYLEIEIVNFDSRQVYQDLPIITAQPSEAEKKECPHHLYGFLGLKQKISAGKFVDLARNTIFEVSERNNYPFLVGGTGLYLRSLVYGLADIPDVPEDIQQEIENEFQKNGVESIRVELMKCDPQYCASISLRDRQKMSRALGVFRATGKTFSQWHREQNQTPYYNALKIGVRKELSQLTPDLDKRISRMIDMGAVQEVEKAWIKSVRDSSCPAFSGIGCKELIDYFEGKTDFNTARDRWMANTRAYAKRQLTWFRKEENVHWVEGRDYEQALDLVRKFA